MEQDVRGRPGQNGSRTGGEKWSSSEYIWKVPVSLPDKMDTV